MMSVEIMEIKTLPNRPIFKSEIEIEGRFVTLYRSSEGHKRYYIAVEDGGIFEFSSLREMEKFVSRVDKYIRTLPKREWEI